MTFRLSILQFMHDDYYLFINLYPKNISSLPKIFMTYREHGETIQYFLTML